MKVLAIVVLFGLAQTDRHNLEHGHDGRKFYRVCFAKCTVKARIDRHLDSQLVGQVGIGQLVRHLVVRFVMESTKTVKLGFFQCRRLVARSCA